MKRENISSFQLNLKDCRERVYNLSNFYRINGTEPLKVEYSTAKTFCSAEYHCSFSPANHNCFMLFQKGSGTLIYDGVTYFPKAGDFFLLHAGHNWEFYTDKEDLWEILWLNTRTAVVDSAISDYYLGDVVAVPTENWAVPLNTIYQTIAHSNESIYERREKVFRAVFSMITDIYRLTVMPKAKNSQENDAITMKTYIDEHISEPLSIPDLARLTMRSPGNATTIFKHTFGLSLKRYILQAKFKLAEHYLLQGDLSVNQISDSLSFCNEQHFSQSFRKIYGCSPSQFQKKYRKK